MTAEEKYQASLLTNKGRDISKIKWREEASQKGLEFLCKDIFSANNAWYLLPCGHIDSICIRDVVRNKFKCIYCQMEKYKEECINRGFEYIEHYCEDAQTFIRTSCVKCGTEARHRASSLTNDRKSMVCQTCKEINWNMIANQNGFTWLKYIDLTFALYKCNSCNRILEKRLSDMNKGEVACECKNEAYLAEIESWAKKEGFTLVNKIDSTWSIFKCLYCNKENRLQQSAMKIGSVRCSECNPKKSNIQKKIENYLSKLGVPFQNELVFDDLIGINGGRLRYDIYSYSMSDQKVIWIIEVDGIQHHKPVTFHRSISKEENFEYTQKHDSIKNEYAKVNNIPLLRIAYNDKNWQNKVADFLRDVT